ncbi:MAG TPA: aquaporin [Paraburkholderia sp.]|jgi:aquaporin Z|nr:aquaporin [Paraburkholderia sp.]
MRLGTRLMVECAGTGWLVFAGCAGAALNTGAPSPDWCLLGTPLAFGLALAVAAMAAARPGSAHFNPAVTIGYAVARRFPVRDIVPYLVAQTLGAIVGAALLAWIASGRPGFSLPISEFGVNGYGIHSPSDYALTSAFVIELVMSFAFVSTHLVMSCTPGRRRVAALATAAAFAAVYLITMPVTGGAINPARSTGPALLVGGSALDQLWLFWAAPMLGGLGAGACHAGLAARAGRRRAVVAETGGPA